jgi:hypothetical protein
MACSSVVGNVADQTSRHTASDDSNVPAAVPTAQGYRLRQRGSPNRFLRCILVS